MSPLRDVLEELALEAPRPAPQPRLWDQGRRLRRRDRVVTGGLALVMVLLIGGLATLVTMSPTLVGPADEVVPEGAVPSRIVDAGALGLEPEDDLAIGRASAAFVSTSGGAIVIGATDGRYHLLDLPGWRQGSDALALSPAGARLAWQDAEDPRSTRLSILDLQTGEVVTAEPDARPGVTLRDLSWSPTGAQLAWVGDASAAPRTTVGVVSWGGTPREAVDVRPDDRAGRPGRRTVTGVAVDDVGNLAIGRGDNTLVGVLPDGEQRPLSSGRVAGTPAHFSPSGEWLALSTGPDTSSAAVAVADGGRLVRHPFPDGTFESAAVRPAGWVDDRLQLLLVQSAERSESELVVTTPQVDGSSTWRGGVGSVDPVAAATLTVAVDLLPDPDGSSTQAFTHDFGDPTDDGLPDWLPPGLAALVLLGLGLLLVRRGML